MKKRLWKLQATKVLNRRKRAKRGPEMTVIVTTGLEVAYEEFKVKMPRLKEQAEDAVTSMSAGPVDSNFVKGLYSSLNRSRTYLNNFKTLSGLTQFVKDHEGNQSYDVVAEINALVSAIQDAIDQVDADFPSTGTPPNRYRQFVKMEDGVVSFRSFPSGGTAALRTDLTAIATLIGSV